MSEIHPSAIWFVLSPFASQTQISVYSCVSSGCICIHKLHEVSSRMVLTRAHEYFNITQHTEWHVLYVYEHRNAVKWLPAIVCAVWLSFTSYTLLQRSLAAMLLIVSFGNDTMSLLLPWFASSAPHYASIAISFISSSLQMQWILHFH